MGWAGAKNIALAGKKIYIPSGSPTVHVFAEDSSTHMWVTCSLYLSPSRINLMPLNKTLGKLTGFDGAFGIRGSGAHRLLPWYALFGWNRYCFFSLVLRKDCFALAYTSDGPMVILWSRVVVCCEWAFSILFSIVGFSSFCASLIDSNCIIQKLN